MILVIVSIGPHMLTTSVIVRAVAEPSWAGCSANPAVNHVAMSHLHQTAAAPMVNT